MKTKHTPGPWDARGNTIICAAPPHHMHEYVVLGDTEDAWSDDETKIADARLMAASPEMLDTLKRMRNTFGLLSQSMPKKLSKMAQGLAIAAEEMDNAIQKAEGND